jgi:hypothetical protein
MTNKEYAYLAFRMWEGDDVVDQLVEALQADGFIDENQEWKYDDEDDIDSCPAPDSL